MSLLTGQITYVFPLLYMFFLYSEGYQMGIKIWEKTQFWCSCRITDSGHCLLDTYIETKFKYKN